MNEKLQLFVSSCVRLVLPLERRGGERRGRVRPFMDFLYNNRIFNVLVTVGLASVSGFNVQMHVFCTGQKKAGCVTALSPSP